MRGSPLLRALLAFAIILSLGFPLWRLTHGVAAVNAVAKVVPPSTSKAIRLQLEFTLPPLKFAVLHLDRELWSESARGAELERELQLAYPAEGIDLKFRITWPPNAPLAAARVRLTDPAGDVHEKSIWGNGDVVEVLTFP